MKRVLFVNGPTQDPWHPYVGWPTSLLYAIGPSIAAMRAGELGMSYESELFDPGKWAAPADAAAIFAAFDQQLARVDILCASATYDSLWPVLRLFQRAKERRPEVITVLGGPHVDETHQLVRFNDAKNHRDLIDYSIAGDADQALLALLRGIAAGQPSPAWAQTGPPAGVFWTYQQGRLIDQGRRPLQLEALPPIPVELADTLARRENLARLVHRPDLAPLVETVAQRGCYYACECCSERGIKLNPRPVESIVAEVEIRKQQGFRAVYFNDSTFGLHRDLLRLLDELARTGMKFGCLNRFDHLTDSTILDMYKRAGFVYFYCAVEQFDDSVLQGLTKSESTERMELSTRRLYEREFAVGVSLLYGLRNESRRSVDRTLDFVGNWVDRGLIRLVSQSALSLHPGTPVGCGLDETFDKAPPHRSFPFNQFEEGHWYHPQDVTAAKLEWIAAESKRRFGHVLVRHVDTASQESATNQPQKRAGS